MAKGVFFVTILMFLGLMLVLFQGNGVKGMMTAYFEEKGYVCEKNYCQQCVINNIPCTCKQDTCDCGDKTVDRKMCTVKLLWKELPKD